MYSKVFLILRKATTKVYALGDSLGVVDYCTIFHSRWYLLINIFNDTVNIYHEGTISRIPDSYVFSLLDIRKRYKRSQ